MTPPTQPATPLSTNSLWTKWGLNHLEVLCAGGVAGAFVVGKIGLTPLAIGCGLVLAVSWLVRHVIKS